MTPGEDPRDIIRRWLPHLLLAVMAALVGWWLLLVVAPLVDALLMGASVAILTSPFLFEPIDRSLARAVPVWPCSYRRYISSLLSTTALALGAAALLILLLWAVLGIDVNPLKAAAGLAFQHPVAVHLVVDAVVRRVGAILQLYPALGLTPQDVRGALEGFLVHSHFGPEFVKLVFTGTGGLIVEVVLTFTSIFYCTVEAPRMAELVLSRLPLAEERKSALRRRFARTVQHLMADTVAKALVIGVALGTIAYLIGGFNPVLVCAVGIFAGLLPVVGHAFVWLPLASLLASAHDWMGATCLAVASWTTAWLIERVFVSLARALGTDETWLSFLLFVSVVGGILGMGARGLVLGPASVIALAVLLEYVSSLYGSGSAQSARLTAQPGADAGGRTAPPPPPASPPTDDTPPP